MKKPITGVLERIFQKRKQRNSKYSLRSFARDLKISPGRLSLIMNEKDEPGPKFIENILQMKSLTAEEREELERSIYESKSPFTNVRDNKELHFSEDELEIAWKCTSIFSLLKINHNGFPEHVIAERLGLSKTDLKECLKFLTKNKFIALAPTGEYQTKTDRILFPVDQFAELAVAHNVYLRDIFPLSQKKMAKQGESFVGNLTAAFAVEAIPAVKNILKEAMAKISKEASIAGAKKVFHLTVQLFPVDKGE